MNKNDNVPLIVVETTSNRNFKLHVIYLAEGETYFGEYIAQANYSFEMFNAQGYRIHSQSFAGNEIGLLQALGVFNGYLNSDYYGNAGVNFLDLELDLVDNPF